MTTEKKYWNTSTPTIFIYNEWEYIWWIHINELDDNEIKEGLNERINLCNTEKELQEVCDNMFFTLNLL